MDRRSALAVVGACAAASAAAPMVVIVHGGFWRTAYGAELGLPLAADLLARGYAAVNVEYRRVGTDSAAAGGGWPQTGADVAVAIDALGTDGQRLAGGRLDLKHVVGLEHSAGGQLVWWAASRPAPAVRLTGVVSQRGVLDLIGAADQDLGGGAVGEYLGGLPDQVPDAYAQASPVARLPLGVPSICVHGRADTIIPFDQSQRFVAAAVARGDTSTLLAHDGDHFDPITVGTRAWTLSVQALAQLTGS